MGTFYGRTEELETLNQWLVLDRCRLIAILGLGGMGKSSLAAKITQQVQGDFEAIIWRSLRNAPTLETLLAELVPFVSQQQETQATPERLLAWLRQRRCLIILDNVETILQAGTAWAATNRAMPTMATCCGYWGGPAPKLYGADQPRKTRRN